MPLNSYVTLGRSGLRVSPFCLGTMTFGDDLGWGSGEEESRTVIDRYRDLGGNFLDTANVYTRGHSEKIIGDHIGARSSVRDGMVIATKFFGNLYPGDPNGGGSGRKAILAACEQSLRRLRTDYIDLYWMHCWDVQTPIEETMSALDALVRSGKVRYIGFSDTPAWKSTHAQLIAQFRGWAPLIAIQLEYSLAQRTVEGELIPFAAEFGLGVTPWSPLKGGVLSGKYTRENASTATPARPDLLKRFLDERVFKILDKLIPIAKEINASPASVALAWLVQRPQVTSTIIGARNVAQLDQNLAGLELKLSPEHVKALDDVSRPSLDFPADFIRGAGAFAHGGISVNGVQPPVLAMAPKNDSERY